MNTCPKCGYCPHCGRGNQLVPQYPFAPQYPLWQQPVWYGGNIGINPHPNTAISWQTYTS
jgi:hypothetical protein